MRDTTLVYLIKREEGEIKEICLALKKRGFGINRWNGVGGKLKEGETIEAGAKRETKEEIGAVVKELNKVAELEFYFPHNSDWDQKVHVYLAEEWEGELAESDEMKPEWFLVEELLYSQMWPDDPFWLPEVLKGNLVKGVFEFGEGDVIREKKVEVVDKL
jgi:8-oxo-dGTP diphosphatase / 2-hydroxy-dATP diphosphatase